jgi:uncharacterized repeat protein (TIGR03803 family)
MRTRRAWKKVWKSTVLAALLTVGLLLCAGVSAAQTYTPLYTYSINAGAYSGILPAGIMSQGRDGFLYTTVQNNGLVSRGTTFKMSLSGVPTTLYNFCSLTGCTDGSYPDGGLILGADGNLYGTTTGGGSHNFGTTFKMTPTGTVSTLWNFTAGGTDDAAPWYPVLQAQDGNFWGVSSAIYNGTYGAAYKLTPTGTLTGFPFNYTNGSIPDLPTQGTDGNFYGVARGGGAHGLGTVYKITPAGVISVLHDFAGYPSDGNLPVGILAQGNDGNFYGMTYQGGASNVGTVFKITPSGTLTLLYSFTGYGFGDGALPYTGLTLGTDGNFYGSTNNGGTKNAGALLKVTPAGAVSVLYSFCSVTCNDGYGPQTPLVQDTNGKFYGNSTGNSLGGAEFFTFDVGLKPFAGLVIWSGKVGKTIGILGQGFTGTTKVSFNGTTAAFTVSSDTFLTATVPAGATTGFITVVTPGATLKSNRKFLVTPSILSFTPPSGQVGTQVIITGTSFTGATGVLFGGVKATVFSVDSDTQITATVPTSAKTGKIQVKTPGGTATSATSFTVLP